MDVISQTLRVPVEGAYDLVVAGGGIAGVAAAVQAARLGEKVLLIEKGVYLGGLATAGLIDYYEPLCDGLGRRITSGIAEELLHQSIAMGGGNLPPGWKDGGPRGDPERRYATRFNPSYFIFMLDEFLARSGAEVLFDTVLCSVVAEAGRVTHVVAESKSGRSAFACRAVVDATGDADVFALCGSGCVLGDNFLTYCAYETDLERIGAASEAKDAAAALKLRMWGSDRLGRSRSGNSRLYRGVSAQETTAFVKDGRALAAAFYKTDGKTRAPAMVPSMAQFRTTRRIEGAYSLAPEDENKRFEDSIGTICDFSRKAAVFEIPYRTLYNPDAANLLTAGRTIASRDHAWEVTRVIPSAALTGQAAGAAAHLARKGNQAVSEIDVGALQSLLSDAGVLIHMK